MKNYGSGNATISDRDLDAALLALNQINTTEEGEVFLPTLEWVVPTLLSGSDPSDRKRFQTAIHNLKARLHPANNSSEARSLTEGWESETDTNMRRERAAKYVVLCQALMKETSGQRYVRLVDAMDRAWAPVAKLDQGTGRSNRAKRAKTASNVFSKHAGLSRIEGADVDLIGNAIGTEFDLGLDGAYDGLRVVMLHQYTGEGFDGSRPVQALQGKGFKVDHHRGYGTPSAEELKESLRDASQIWIISNARVVLTEEHINVIVEAWLEGLGVYIFGDNDPFYCDANRVLKAMQPHFEELSSSGKAKNSPGLLLSGNSSGGRNVVAWNDNTVGGFAPHLLTTGLVELYEGVTVSSMDRQASTNAGFEEILLDHEDNLVVAARRATRNQGPVIVDGAFTKLFCHWNEGGSARFVRNCACWLSTVLDHEVNIETKAKETEKKPPKLDLDGAFVGECAVTAEVGPLALLATTVSDPDVNTDDYALDNNLAVARRNLILCGQPLGLDTAKLFLQQGQDPFSRRPVACVVPLVSLSKEDNLSLVTELANDLFMGGRSMNRHSLNILLSVCEEMMMRRDHTDDEARDALRFLTKEILHNAVSTPDMLKGVGVGGPTVPLIQGLRANMTLIGDVVPLRKAFAHVSRIVRILTCNDVDDHETVDENRLRQMARRSLLKTILGALAKIGKADEIGEGKKLMRAVDDVIFEKFTFDLIPVSGTARCVDLRGVGSLVERGSPSVNLTELEEDAARTAAVLNVNPLVSASEITRSLLSLRRRGVGKWRINIEPLLEELLKNDNDPFRKTWNATCPPVDESEARRSTEAQAEKDLAGSFVAEAEDHASIPWPGFATPFGPSVFYCKCGMKFGDPDQVLDKRNIEELKKARNRHFQEVFGSDENGYPTPTSAHFPLHRAIQRVLTREDYRHELERSYSMCYDVAKYLRKKARGNVHSATLEDDIERVVDSYLDCRRKGMAEPFPGELIDFDKKARIEQKAILDGTVNAHIRTSSKENTT